MKPVNIIDIKNNSVTFYQLAKILYLLFWLLKPFYVFKSGSLQPGDLCLGLSFLAVLASNDFRVRVDEKDNKLFLYVITVGIINYIYFFVYSSTDFIKPTLYFIFNFMCVSLARIFLEDLDFIRKLNSVLKVNLFVQLAVYLLELGRWYYGSRYMGTYNDPNQLGFAVLSTYCLIYCLNRKQDTKHQWIYFLISIYLIFKTSSVGMFFGISLIFVFEQYFRLAKINSGIKKIWYIAYLVVISCGLVYAGTYFLLVVTGALDTEIYILQRVANKFEGGSIISNFIDDRNLNVFFREPFRILYGSGEGFFLRWGKRGGELHSTWLSLLYYYGVLPFCLLFSWIKNNLKSIDWYIIPVYICIFAEAFTLINHRQPSFWVLIVMGSFLKRYKNKGFDIYVV